MKDCNLEERRPQVLLMGNGLVRAANLSWVEVIEKTAKDGFNLEKFKNEQDEYGLPYAILSLVSADVESKKRQDKYEEVLKDYKYQQSMPNLKQFVSLPFDAFITTNYTYEIENEYLPGFSGLSKTTQRKKSISYQIKTPKNENHVVNLEKYLIQRANKVTANAPEIWHIHGEACRKSSLVLSHDEYGRQSGAILGYLYNQGNRYEKSFYGMDFLSWIDYFIMSDVYIVGFGFDFTEFDLWWMLGRRLREKGRGKMVFFEPKSAENVFKQRALKEMDVEIENLGMEKMDDSFSFDKFYSDAAEAIADLMGRA